MTTGSPCLLPTSSALSADTDRCTMVRLIGSIAPDAMIASRFSLLVPW